MKTRLMFKMHFFPHIIIYSKSIVIATGYNPVSPLIVFDKLYRKEANDLRKIFFEVPVKENPRKALICALAVEMTEKWNECHAHKW